jgi:hypothetical protein
VTSTFAEIILGLFIPVAIGAFFLLRPLQAGLVVALGGEMFLPEGPAFRIPFTPPWGKHNLIYLCIFVGCLLRFPRRVTKWPKEKWFIALSLLVLTGGAATALSNSDAIPLGSTGEVFLPGLTFKDGMYTAISTFVASCLPFYLGYSLVTSAKDIEKLLIGVGVAGLVYSFFAIVEMRMSPQWHHWIYGYGVGGWFGQTIRWGGYRPMVFMPHGLALARFMMATTLALFVLAKVRRRLFGLPIGILAWFQAVILVCCRSTGAITFAALGVPMIRFIKPKWRLFVACVLAIVILLYPLLRSMNLFPVSNLLDAAGFIQKDREGSLRFRFSNEDALLAHARERIAFGWGEYRRNKVFDNSGQDTAITDGYWIIVIGTSGLAGFLGTFGMLLWPVVWTRRRLRDYGDRADKQILSGLALILALLTADLIPNGLWSYYPFFIAGSLTRRLRELEPTGNLVRDGQARFLSLENLPSSGSIRQILG